MADLSRMQLSGPTHNDLRGQCASMERLLLTAGAKGSVRAAEFPDTDPSLREVPRAATDIQFKLKNPAQARIDLSDYRQDPARFLNRQRDVERDKIMSAAQAKEYGLIDEVIAHAIARSTGGGAR